MKYMITGAEPRGESDRLDPEELNRRIRHHQQALDELLRARARRKDRAYIRRMLVDLSRMTRWTRGVCPVAARAPAD